MQTTVIDTHLHLYPNYDLPKAINRLLDQTQTFSAETKRVACLAERHDCHFFDAIASGETQLNGFTLGKVSKQALSLTRDQDQRSLTLLPGRQVISAENIEILALSNLEDIADGQAALDIIYQCNRNNGVPVVAWSPGKWFAKRGELVKHLLDSLKPSDFMIGDTTLRPYGWLTPRLMQHASKKGYGVIAGSDPLPFQGEEAWLGAYYSVVESKQNYSASDLLLAMKNHADDIRWVNSGKRCNAFSLFQRLRKNAASKRA